ncbi:MAG: M18 family aminopeptidase [Anaerococcus sp.]|nr:M18 family aminopeptidase [Anaerococcus sp.]
MNSLNNSLEFSKDLISFIDASPVSYFAVKNAIEILKENGYEELKENSRWDLSDYGKYFINRDDTALIAINLREDLEKGFDIIGSHTESPTFKLKSKPEINDTGYLKLNVEVYGGMIYSTWLDRTLSLAGKVVYEDKGNLIAKLVKIDRDLLTIPNAAIHMNRAVNKDFVINPQDNLYPILRTIGDDFNKDGYIQRLLADELGIDPLAIIDYDLSLYDRQKGSLMADDTYQVGRIDNLGSVHASLKAFVNTFSSRSNVLILNDNEEIGSRTRTGANSPFLGDFLKRLFLACGKDMEEYYMAIENSFLISADGAHAIHPNFKSFSDPTNIVKLNGGLAIKIAANGAYTTSIESKARILKLARNLGINLQSFHNRNDKTGGSTIGPITQSRLGIRSIDIGEPILAMHSIRELGGVKDHFDAYKLYKKFYEED